MVIHLHVRNEHWDRSATKRGWKYNHLKGKVKTTETTRYNKDNVIESTEKQYFDSTEHYCL